MLKTLFELGMAMDVKYKQNLNLPRVDKDGSNKENSPFNRA